MSTPIEIYRDQQAKELATTLIHLGSSRTIEGFLKDFFDAAVAYLKEHPEDPWVSVEEKMPGEEDGFFQLIIGIDDCGYRDIYKAYLGDDNETWFFRDIEFKRVTHWKKLPAPPNKIRVYE